MLEMLSSQLSSISSLSEKASILDAIPAVRNFFEQYQLLTEQLSVEERSALAQVVAIGQAKQLFGDLDISKVELNTLRSSLEKLVLLDRFYRELGGIVGYQTKILQLLAAKNEPVEKASYHSPFFFDIAEETTFVQESSRWGLEALKELAEIYPLGGAADRLHLVEKETGTELPAAKLPFAGKMLFEHLIRDLQAREFLYFQVYGEQLTTPIAVMTSLEKNNHSHVLQICEQLHWFGRPKDSIRFFTQPLVPTVTANGDWCMAGPLKPLLKPGGHGAIWKLARDSGIFDWLKTQQRRKALIRQINNPMAGLDYGLLAFTGIGWKKEMIFGFASCPRLLKAAEGVNVLIEKGKQIVLTNVEYCDFTKFGIEDLPLKEGEPYSRFSSNTNILFADLDAVSKAVDAMPFPGLLINLKKASYTTESGERQEEVIARLESTMQNIADVFVEEKQAALKTEKTFVTYNRRHKTISTAKKAFVLGNSYQETPENCFYDLLFSHRELLLECGFELPNRRSLEEYLAQGPEVLFLYHPALGPLYASIREKLVGGKLGMGAELLLEIADFKARNLKVEGSLQIIAEQPMGHFENGILHYSKNVGKCVLENVTIENQGIDWSNSHPFWKMEPRRLESVKIILKGRSEFHAKNLHLKGNHTFVVEDGSILKI